MGKFAKITTISVAEIFDSEKFAEWHVDGAHVTFVHASDGAIDIGLDDEQPNERGPNTPENAANPRVLKFTAATVVGGHPSAVIGGQIIEALVVAKGIYRFSFTDRGALVLSATRVDRAP